MSQLLRKAAVGLVTVCGVLGVAAAPAATADYPTETFAVFKWDIYDEGHGYTSGSITWYNRTANIQGTVVDSPPNFGYVTAYFEAYAGSKKIDSTTRTANAGSDLGSHRDSESRSRSASGSAPTGGPARPLRTIPSPEVNARAAGPGRSPSRPRD